ncbi:hypothetical protein SNOG_05843 [Parastagonospora nodorum SN15]|uniref:Uncharacterized protein n=1 Tax=Phaeosphaeria nodorum (strain SN15 / ATCC MYA-4574 / FGSC 10173) TaxID=321614 RepID=Q0UQX1_PHANO|nr:hypothetical protein SNOG_05843 [Parastagonospora nodorum SN15]EAT86907.1 hypothetical protein SNOG_05843 [Parastagonospora nodorum SN15]
MAGTPTCRKTLANYVISDLRNRRIDFVLVNMLFAKDSPRFCRTAPKRFWYHYPDLGSPKKVIIRSNHSSFGDRLACLAEQKLVRLRLF